MKEEIIYIQHEAGEFAQGLQVCRLCGHIITDYTGHWASDDGSPVRGFSEGKVYITGNNPVTTSTIAPLYNYGPDDNYTRKIIKCTRPVALGIGSGAEFSDCKKYRYKLWRIWDTTLPIAMCIGLNPSNANVAKNDPTITNLVKILSKLNYGGFYMMNLFAWISSKPKELLTCNDPLGENEHKLKEVELLCDDVIVCWGQFKEAEQRILQILPDYPNAKCFGVNKDGTPCHPLALMYNGTVKSPEIKVYNHPVI